MKKHYIQAVLESLRAGQDASKVLAGLVRTLEIRSHTRLLVSILRGVEKQLSSSRGDSKPLVIVAKETDLKAAEVEIKAILKSLNAPQEHLVQIDDTIIGGVIATYNNKILDHSYKSKLVSLYRNIKN